MNSSGAEGWHRAMIRELQTTKEFDTLDLVRPPTDRNIVGSRWVFARKQDGTLKARWVAQGFSQSAGLDYGEMFRPACRVGSMRLFLALVNEKDWPVYHMDSTNAFLQGLCEATSRFNTKRPQNRRRIVCKLKRDLYGLDISSLNGFNTLTDALRKIGFIALSSDQCVLILRRGSDQIIVTIYVDDILLTGNNPKLIAEVKRSLHERFVIKDLGEVSKILGIHIVRDREKGRLSLDQKEFTESILERFGMAECNETHLPGVRTPPDDQKPPSDTPLSRDYGAFMYLQTSTRPDLSFSVLQLSRNMNAPMKGHFGAVKRKLRYLKGPTGLSITHHRGHFKTRGYVDAACASDEKRASPWEDTFSSLVMLL
ncbi:unnamed protein product [Discosporangium mesarthrocarpum]